MQSQNLCWIREAELPAGFQVLHTPLTDQKQPCKAILSKVLKINSQCTMLPVDIQTCIKVLKAVTTKRKGRRIIMEYQKSKQFVKSLGQK